MFTSIKKWLRARLFRVKPEYANHEATQWEWIPYNFKIDWFAGGENLPVEKRGSSTGSLYQPDKGSSSSREVGGSKGGLTLVWSDTIPDDDSLRDPSVRFPSGRTLW